jgi:hypothetical protein
MSLECHLLRPTASLPGGIAGTGTAALQPAAAQAQALFEDLRHPDAEQVRHKLKALATGP